MSNHMDIIDATSVDGRAEVRQWNEDDDEEDGEAGEASSSLYWRQWYNSLTGRTSEPRTHCICKNAYNPDKVLVACSNPDCGIWLHDDCLLDDALSGSYHQKILNDASELKRLNEYIEFKKLTSTKKKSRQPPCPWTGKLEAVLDVKNTPARAIVSDITDPNKDPWEYDLACLKCKSSLD
jgi:hypothetical protein